MSGNKQSGSNKQSQRDDAALTAEKESRKPDGTTRKTGGHDPAK